MRNINGTEIFVGIDVGTSGCRSMAIDAMGNEMARAGATLPPPRRAGSEVEQDPEEWWTALCASLDQLLTQIPRERVRALAIDGTSGTVLITDQAGHVLAPALLYSDSRAVHEAARIVALAPRESAAHGTGSGVPKLLWLLSRYPNAARVHTPADWLSARFTGRTGISDSNNVIKLGWDPVARRWPHWLSQCLRPSILPSVVAPGTPLDTITSDIQRRFGLPAGVRVIAGTTDSTAAIIATGASEIGDAITSLGSTVVVKMVAHQPIFAPAYGIYSQPYGEHWLVGGGSNAGGAVLRHFFTDTQLAQLELRIDPAHSTGLDYYPLLAPGERFPVNDPAYPARLTPRPADDAAFLQGLLEGLSRIEAQGYHRLAQLGVPYPRRVLTVGGGSRSNAWTAIRAQTLAVPVKRAACDEAAYGSGLLAAASV